MEYPSSSFELGELTPRLRGRLHAYAFYGALASACLLIVSAQGERARLSALIYGISLCSLFGISGKYHRWQGSARAKSRLRRADHSSIFIFIAASNTPLALLATSGSFRWLLLGLAWGGALLGVLLALLWTDAPRALRALTYVVLGSLSLLAFPQLAAHLSTLSLLLWLFGLLLYGLGALIYARKRPDPWPATFGFHELFHALVILSVLMHLAVLTPLLLHPPGLA